MSDVEDQLSLLYDEAYILADEENFTMMNELLERIEVESSSIEYLVMALSVTLPYRDSLPSRSDFFDRVRNRIVNENPVDVDLILIGLK